MTSFVTKNYTVTDTEAAHFLSIATDGKDGNGLKLEKHWPILISSSEIAVKKSPKN